MKVWILMEETVLDRWEIYAIYSTEDKALNQHCENSACWAMKIEEHEVE